MDPNESRCLDWKTCFKKILAPHLLNPPEEQTHASQTLITSYNEEQVDTCQNIVNPQNDSVDTTPSLKNPEKSENIEKNVADDCSLSFINGCQDSDSPHYELNDAENPILTEENIKKIIAADAEELGKRYKPLKFRKDKKKFNMAESSRKAPDWNVAFKNVLNPKSALESALKAPEELADEKPLPNPVFLDSWKKNSWAFHTLRKKEEERKNFTEVKAQNSSESCNKERQYYKEDKKVLEIFRHPRTFKRTPKPHMNIFDGAGVNCFKDNVSSQSRSMQPKNVPPPGGWVCVKPLTMEEIRKKPPNLILTECWDWDEDDW